jgi:putative protein kinase ArgK-like GTPase of G3E family
MPFLNWRGPPHDQKLTISAEDADRFHVVSGGPGAGKSTLIAALGRAGYPHSIEAGRSVAERVRFVLERAGS